MKRTFAYDPAVERLLRDNSVRDEQLRVLENDIMRGGGVTIAGTAGLKKIRCASASKGKSGSIRVLFADYPLFGRTYVLAAFGKSDKANITRAEARELASLKRMLDLLMEKAVQNEK